MPQFDPSTFGPQLFWLAVTFVTLYIALSTIALPKIGAVLDERQRKIDDNLDKAAGLKAEADAAVAVYEKALAAARANAQATLKETGDRLAQQAEQRNKELGEKLAAQIKAGEARIGAAKEQAMAHVREVAVDVAKSATERLIGKTADSKVEAAVTAALQESR